MPNELVLIRHGESEPNVVQELEREDPNYVAPPGFYDRPDWQHRLSRFGEGQAKLAGAWVLDTFGPPEEYFDRWYVSTAIRGRETAEHVGPNCDWLPDDRVRERDWGIFGSIPYAERLQRFPDTEKRRKENRWYAALDGGESQAGIVFLSVRDLWDTLHREMEGQRVIIVSHGDKINAVRFLTEHMLPEEYDAMKEDETQDITNGSIVIYNRVNPEDPTDIHPKVKWRRMIRPHDPDNSPFGGEWVELPGRRFFRGADLHRTVEIFPRLLDDED